MKDKLTIIRQLDKIADCVYAVPYDELTDYLKGIRDMINLLNGEEQEMPLCDAALVTLDKIYIDLKSPFKKGEQKKSKNNPTVPINITPIFTVNIYKDMEYANKIACSNTCKTYKTALRFFNKERKIAKGNYFIELVFCLEIKYKKENKIAFIRTEEETFVDNYCDRKEQERI